MAVAVRPRLGVRACVHGVLSPSDTHPSTSLTCRTQCLSLRVHSKELGGKRSNFFQVVGVADQVWSGVLAI